jgi:DinB superfamily
MMPTRDETLKTLAEARAELLARYSTFTPQELEANCTESETPGGVSWRAKDHLAHLTLIERAFQGMVRRSLRGDADPVGFSRTGAKNREDVLAWIHRNNQNYVNEHHEDDMETLLEELERARQDTLALLEQVSDEQLAIPLPGAPWADGTIGGVLITNAQHERLHLSWVEKGLQQHQ